MISVGFEDGNVRAGPAHEALFTARHSGRGPGIEYGRWSWYWLPSQGSLRRHRSWRAGMSAPAWDALAATSWHGQALAKRGSHAKALEQFRAALLVNRASTEYRLALSESLVALGRLGEASLHPQEVLRHDPSQALPNLLLARIAASRGRTEDAVGYYQRAIFGFWDPGEAGLRMQARWELIDRQAKMGAVKQVIAGLLEAAAEAVIRPHKSAPRGC